MSDPADTCDACGLPDPCPAPIRICRACTRAAVAYFARVPQDMREVQRRQGARAAKADRAPTRPAQWRAWARAGRVDE